MATTEHPAAPDKLYVRVEIVDADGRVKSWATCGVRRDRRRSGAVNNLTDLKATGAIAVDLAARRLAS
jgi:hypothetical protein